CGGHNITDLLAENPAFTVLVMLLVGKFLFSMICFGSGAPGGIFFPLLIIGSIIGAIFGKVAISSMGIEADLLNNFIILSMAGFFTAIVRAPITGIILITEMSGSYHQILPLSIISIIAYVVANLVRSKPVYDLLLDSYLENFNHDTGEESDKKIMIEAIVHHDAPISNMLVKDIKWPERTLLLSIRRHGRELIPKGNTLIHDGDHLIAMTDLNQEWLTREELTRLTSNED
ncbi:MAG: chloride channel protein, partial [Lentisphaeria bacterium]